MVAWVWALFAVTSMMREANQAHVPRSDLRHKPGSYNSQGVRSAIGNGSARPVMLAHTHGPDCEKRYLADRLLPPFVAEARQP